MAVRPGAEHLIHRDAAYARIAAPAITLAHIGRTFIDGDIPDQRTDQAILENSYVSIVGGTAVIEPSRRPIKRIGQLPTVFVGVNQPGDANLMAIVHAGDGL